MFRLRLGLTSRDRGGAFSHRDDDDHRVDVKSVVDCATPPHADRCSGGGRIVSVSEFWWYRAAFARICTPCRIVRIGLGIFVGVVGTLWMAAVPVPIAVLSNVCLMPVATPSTQLGVIATTGAYSFPPPRTFVILNSSYHFVLHVCLTVQINFSFLFVSTHNFDTFRRFLFGMVRLSRIDCR